jgi:hypothetical protein
MEKDITTRESPLYAKLGKRTQFGIAKTAAQGAVPDTAMVA